LSTEEVCSLYIGESRGRQPHGPYTLGGWSVGGIFAYVNAQNLLKANEGITDLIFG
jgi:thioesterase domain-containing protein